MEKELTFKQKLFVKHYMINGYNATKAYMAAYPDSSYEAAISSASELLTKPNIIEYLQKEQEEIADVLLLTKEKVILDVIDIIKSSKDDPKQKHNANKAIDTLNKMLGFNDVRRIDITTDGKSLTDLIGFEEKDNE